MKCKAEGLLAHHFHGTYWCTIALYFETIAQAEAVLLAGVLDEPDWPAWNLGTQRGTLVWSGNTAQLDALKVRLGNLGADTDKIDSCAHSIDYGEEFEISVDVPDPDQLNLDFQGA